MPYSDNGGKQETLNWFIENKDSITSILDVGVGSGTYFNLLKAYINPNTRFEGVEVWMPYITQFNLKNKYDFIYHKDIRKLTISKKYSVGIAGDILEHLTKKEAISVVDKLLNSCTTLIISIPIIYCHQDAYEGNPYEIHVKPDWTHEEILETWNKYIFKSVPDNIVGVYWLRKNDI